MYSLLIADDEAIIREGLLKLIDFAALGYRVCGEAANGETALNIIRAQCPDVVLIDIRMPRMSGLEAIARARADGYDGKFIILSGYADFEYAKQAIAHGVSGYLGKPIDEDELSERLTAVRAELDRRRMSIEAGDAYRAGARSIALTQLLRGQKPPVPLPDIGPGPWRVCVCPGEKLPAALAGACFAVQLEGDTALIVYDAQGERRLAALTANPPADMPFLACGGQAAQPQDLRASYDQARAVLARRFFYPPQTRVLGAQAVVPPTFALDAPLLERYASDMLGFVQAFSRQQLAALLVGLRDTLVRSGAGVQDVRLFLTDLFLRVRGTLAHLYPAVPLPASSDIFRAFDRAPCLSDILSQFTAHFDAAMDAMGGFTRESVLDDVLHYIEHNFRSNLTLESIAPLFGYNSAYLGKLLSRRVGESFNSYLDRLRVAEAKRLLEQTDMKVYTVAERVGYSNVDYFHVKFKKYVGLSPAQYRAQRKAKAGS